MNPCCPFYPPVLSKEYQKSNFYPSSTQQLSFFTLSIKNCDPFLSILVIHFECFWTEIFLSKTNCFNYEHGNGTRGAIFNFKCPRFGVWYLHAFSCILSSISRTINSLFSHRHLIWALERLSGTKVDGLYNKVDGIWVHADCSKLSVRQLQWVIQWD